MMPAIFRYRSVGRLVFAGLLLALVAACGARVELISSVSESEANEALAALLDGGVEAGKIPGKEGMVSLDVAQSEVSKAIGILRVEGLPRERYAKMGEVFRKEGLISSPLEERARYIWALSQEISSTLSQIDGVVKARVHVVLPERSAGGDPSLPSSAAVFIKHKTGVNLEDSVAQIKRLVANSIPGLSGEKVSVILIASDSRLNLNESLPSTGVAKTDSVSAKTDTVSTPDKAETLLRRVQESPELLWGGIALLLSLLSGGGYVVWRQWKKYKNAAPDKSLTAALGEGG
jgi:type III secretion protein J